MMARSLASDLMDSLPNLAEFQPGELVHASSWLTLTAAAHTVYARAGAHVGGLTFDSPWTSLDFGSGGDDWHAIGDGNLRGELADWTGCFTFSRPLYDTGASAHGYSLTLDVYGHSVEVRARCTRMDEMDGHTGDSTVIATLTAEASGADSEWVSDDQILTPAQVSRGGLTSAGLATFLVQLDARVPDAGVGRIWMVALRESLILDGDRLPRGGA